MQERLKNVPLKPGVYLFEDEDGKVLYVGKAGILRNRMRSYFQSDDKLHPKVRAMMRKVKNFDFVVTDTEVEALILENNLVKAYQPRYNINLRDDKTYPYLKVTIGEEFPGIYITREKKDGVSRYFGPYTDVTSLRETLRLLTGIFPLRTCKNLQPRSRPCLNHDIEKCAAPCTGRVDKEEYRGLVEAFLSFMEGKYQGVLREKEAEMRKAAENLEFEKAARLRDQISGIKKLAEKQKVNLESPYNMDLIGMVTGQKESLALVFRIRSGKIISKDTFWLKKAIDEGPAEMVEIFLKRYYDDNHDIPAEILLDTLPEDPELMVSWLEAKTGRRIVMRVPHRGDKRKLLDMVLENANLLWEEKQQKDIRNENILLHLSEVLDLEVVPKRIECFDVSHLGGEEAVAAMAVFSNGVPERTSYRRFKIKSDQNDDFASLKEALKRRFEQARGGNVAFLPEPDLILVDGGLGQVNAVKAVLDEIESDIPLLGLAKKNEEIFRPGTGKPLVLPRRDEGLKLLQRLRDEAHRLALEYNRQRRSRKLKDSILDRIEGIGPRRKKALLNYFKSISKIESASLEEIAAVPGMSRSAAQNVHDYFRKTTGK
ncbi:MAG: excinuclease ABC subunit UvrC [Syntrophomonadaceae bacterium]|nr:excinuclease ABC subunit UvrC [Syntrophomonadaceae bacterium]